MTIPSTISPDSPFARLENATKTLRDAHEIVLDPGMLDESEAREGYYSALSEYRAALAIADVSKGNALTNPVPLAKG